MQKKRCVNAAAYYIKELYKIREYTMIKKTKERKKKKWMEVSCVLQNRPLSVPGQEVKCSKKGSWGLQKVSLFIKLLPLPQEGTPPKTL